MRKPNNFLTYIKHRVQQANTLNLVALIGLLSIVFGLLVLEISDLVFGADNIPSPIAALATLIILFIWGFIGLVIISRKEIPFSFFAIRGKPAIIFGYIILILAWGLVIFLLSIAIFGTGITNSVQV